MADVVVLLGAGASKLAGAPLMPEFLDVAERLWRLDQTKAAASDFERVFRAVSRLQQVHSKAVLDIQNVESVFAAFDMASILNKFGDYTAEDITALSSSMRVVIARTTELTLQFSDSQSEGLKPPVPYGKFAAVVHNFREKSKPNRTVALLTFNYDLALDHALYWSQIPYGYGFDGKGSAHNLVPLLKLHGSVNWFRCSVCNKIAPWTLREIVPKLNFSPFIAQGLIPFEITPSAQHHIHCDKPVKPEPVLVPPTWNKTEHHRELSAVWSLAAKELSEAEAIILIGYSLPDSDAFFRYLYALGAVGERPLKLFLVINPDTNPATQERFRGLLGPGAQQRFRYEPKTFDQALDLLGKLFA